MDPAEINMKELHEKLREAACNGDEIIILKTLEEEKISINNQHGMNGWTALHWAAKRGHSKIVSLLLSHGADPQIETKNGDTALSLASDVKVRTLLGGEPNGSSAQSELPFVPNYLANPPFPYINQNSSDVKPAGQNLTNSYYPYPPKKVSDSLNQQSSLNGVLEDDELVLKVRIANLTDKDFIEIELPKSKLTFDNLFSIMCEELLVTKDFVLKVRKLPDTIIRKDKDVKRLRNFQELELLLTAKATTELSHLCVAPGPRHVDVVY